jgi:CRISPR-associated protein Cmr6
VEYLRWMRSPDSRYKNPTKVQILQMAEEGADYRARLEILNQRTKLIAGEGNWLKVSCPWRIRVGGHRGPESILLPAFDALGMPFIPSSTLRGVARAQAIRHFMETEGLTWAAAEQRIAPYFGTLDAEDADHTGKVIFLDAYPIAGPDKHAAGLAMDMANNLWKWKNGALEYGSNPNAFFSLQGSTFLIGLRARRSEDADLLRQVKQWLEQGLKAGIGSQINAGYGRLTHTQTDQYQDSFLQVDFTLEGQLIHGAQKFENLQDPYQRDRDGNLWNKRGELRANSTGVAEVRPTAFKSLLRYWFRAFALGIVPEADVYVRMEPQIFGQITPQAWGWLQVNIAQGDTPRDMSKHRGKPAGLQTGQLILSFSPNVPTRKKDELAQLMNNLTWLMFHLGGVGQGARRSCYSRQNRDKVFPPYWRGATLRPDRGDDFWQLSSTAHQFRVIFQERLMAFYQSLSALFPEIAVDLNNHLQAVRPREGMTWTDSVDRHCRIIVCSGQEANDKNYAMATLHSPELKITDSKGQKIYDPDLCGSTGKPSPVWIVDLGDYQVVTVFGTNQDPRREFLRMLREEAESYARLFPLDVPTS